MYYYQSMGETVGPVSFEQLQRHAYEGKVAADTLVRPSESEEWVPAFTIDQLDFTRKVKLPPALPTTTRPRSTPSKPVLVACPFCNGEVTKGVQKCKHCGEFLEPTGHSDWIALFLAFLLGPVGLWYKRCWAAGFAWLVMGIITASAAPLALPVIWLGQMVHAAAARGRR